MYINGEILITFCILFIYFCIKYLKKNESTKNLILYERKRTILNLCKSKKKKIWLTVGDKSTLVSGVVESIIQTYPHHSMIFSSYKNYCTGKFVIRTDMSKTPKINDEFTIRIDNVREVSLKPFSEIENPYREEDCLTMFDFQGDCTSNDNRYYNFILKLQ